MEQITHSHTVRPYYDSEVRSKKYVRDWSGESTEIDHSVSSNRPTERHPVVFDIETTAEPPQRPILVTVYDSKISTLYVNYVRGYDGFTPDDDELSHLSDRFEQSGYEVNELKILRGPSRRWFENRVLRPIARDNGRFLVAHNALFDLGIMAGPDDGLLGTDKIDSDEWDGAFEYYDVKCLHKKAGAQGRLYGFYDQGNGFEGMQIPVADTQTAASALFLPGSLEGACGKFGIDYSDHDGEHGRLTMDYVEYNVDDVAATLDLYYALRERMRDGFNTEMPISSIYSTASIAKDVLERMNYDRTHYTANALDRIAPDYFGGNTEALVTGELIENVTYMDILSQYPTVSALADCWRFMQAERVEVREVDPDDLPDPSFEELQQPAAWAACSDYHVVLSADSELLPVRTEMDDTNTTKVYNADVTHAEPTEHHYFDYLGAKLHADGDPDIEILAAYEAVPVGQQDLQSTTVGGTTIEADDNIMQRGIEERKAKAQENRENGIALPSGKDERTKSLKIMANASYGISAERIVAKIGDPDDDDYERHDVAGKYYNPHVASTITAGGRLQLALGERAAREAGGRLYYCDTDSLITDADVADDVIAAFDDLNPYDKEPVASAPVLEIEDTRHPDTGDEIELDGVNFFALGEKKYAVTNDDDEIIKFTEHGLGHYSNLRDSDRLRAFWADVMDRTPMDVPCSTDGLSDDVIGEPVKWQDSATTATTRSLLDKKFDDTIRYGDFIERTINTDTGIQYLGLDIESEALAIHPDGTIEEGVQVDAERVKTVGEVVDDMAYEPVRRATGVGSRPAVEVVEKQEVTKEASGLVAAWDEMLIKALEKANLDWLL